jgi:hypothetical protein
VQAKRSVSKTLIKQSSSRSHDGKNCNDDADNKEQAFEVSPNYLSSNPFLNNWRDYDSSLNSKINTMTPKAVKEDQI